jgi:iron complex transport system ATP-binding protein
MNPEHLATRQLSLHIGARRLVQALELEVRPGQCWCILGRNGSGKTTLLHCLAGLRPAQAGEVLLNGARIHALPRRQVARQLGLLSQDYEDVFPATVLETALCGRHPHLSPWAWESAEDAARARAALTRVGLAELAGRAVGTLSGGERRRLGIATLLTQDPRFLLLDEPTNHLDLHQQIEVLELLSGLARSGDKALVLVLHDVNLAARFCDHALLLYEDGQHGAGPAAELLTTEHLSRLYGHPMREITGQAHPMWIPE